MLVRKGMIKQQMTGRGYVHSRSDDEFTVGGEYARNLQYVYSQAFPTSAGTVVDLVYFAVDILAEALVIGLYRENVDIDNGVLENNSRSILLSKLDETSLEKELDRLLPAVKNLLKK
jgi:hypothetical protein